MTTLVFLLGLSSRSIVPQQGQNPESEIQQLTKVSSQVSFHLYNPKSHQLSLSQWALKSVQHMTKSLDP